MSKTVESVYKFHGDTNVHDSPNMEREGEVNRIQKPSKLRIIAFKICKPIQSFGKHVKQQFLLDPSESWKRYSLGLLKMPKRGTTLIKSNDVALAFCCPCFLHGINASDIMTGIEGKYEKDQDSGKWVGARFVCAQAMICCGGPCCCLTAPAAGGAVREQIFEQTLRAGKEDEKEVNEKMFFTKRLQMFCLPYCCCPCFAVLQDRRALLRSLEILEETRKELANKAYSMDIHPSNDDNQLNLGQEDKVKIDAIN